MGSGTIGTDSGRCKPGRIPTPDLLAAGLAVEANRSWRSREPRANAPRPVVLRVRKARRHNARFMSESGVGRMNRAYRGCALRRTGIFLRPGVCSPCYRAVGYADYESLRALPTERTARFGRSIRFNSAKSAGQKRPPRSVHEHPGAPCPCGFV